MWAAGQAARKGCSGCLAGWAGETWLPPSAAPEPCPPPLPAAACLPACLPADPDGLKALKFLATRWHIAFSSMLVLGLLLSTLM